MIACLSSVDTGIRLAAANLVGMLAKDAFYSKSIVFPEGVTPNISAVGGEGRTGFDARDFWLWCLSMCERTNVRRGLECVRLQVFYYTDAAATCVKGSLWNTVAVFVGNGLNSFTNSASFTREWSAWVSFGSTTTTLTCRYCLVLHCRDLLFPPLLLRVYADRDWRIYCCSC